jgi:hypothetical protein
MPENKKIKKTADNIKISKDIKELVKARLSVMPRGISVSIGMDGEFSRDELIKHVDNEDAIGRKMIEVDMEFLQALKKGEFYEQNTFSYQV